MSEHDRPSARRQVLTLVMTEQCNLACSYCYEVKSPKNVLSFDIAKVAIVEAFRNEAFDELEIHFFGGEPLLAHKNIIALCEWLWEQHWPRPYICFASTNGTLVHGALKEWVSRNKDRFILGLSFDGTEEMNNLNRSQSSSKIDLDLFRRLWPFQSVKMTVSRETVGNMAEGVIFLQKLGFKVACTHAYGIGWEESDYKIFAREVRKLADFYIENPEIYPCNLMALPVEYAALGQPPRKYCGAGTNLVSIDKNGKRYPCQTFMPMSTGTGQSINMDDMFEKLANPVNYHDKMCDNCCLEPICPTCYGTNYNRSGDPFARDISDCTFTKLRAKATSYMLTKMVLCQDRDYAYLLSKDDSDLRRMISGIELINKSLVIKPFTSTPNPTGAVPG